MQTSLIIPPSTCRRFHFQQTPFQFDALRRRKSAQRAAARHDPVAGNDNRQRVRRHHGADRSGGPRFAGPRRQFPVGQRLTVGDFAGAVPGLAFGTASLPRDQFPRRVKSSEFPARSPEWHAATCGFQSLSLGDAVDLRVPKERAAAARRTCSAERCPKKMRLTASPRPRRPNHPSSVSKIERDTGSRAAGTRLLESTWPGGMREQSLTHWWPPYRMKWTLLRTVSSSDGDVDDGASVQDFVDSCAAGGRRGIAGNSILFAGIRPV